MGLIDLSDCIEWTGHINKGGYGKSGGVLAHRTAYEAVHGPIPKGLEIDHLCCNRSCVNVEHLEAVTPSENIRRSVERGRNWEANRTHCPQGHSYAKHGRRRPHGDRICLICQKAHARVQTDKARVRRQMARGVS